MNREKRRIQSAFDGLTLEMEMMIPEKVKGIVQISHGMAEHKERYEQFMEYLAGYGYMSVIHDHRIRIFLYGGYPGHGGRFTSDYRGH